MRYGGVERVMESAKRRRLVAEEASSVAAAGGTSSPVDDLVHGKDDCDASVFDLEILDCTICAEPLASPIYQCENGHIACASCSRLTKNVCPSCKRPTGFIRNLALEKLIESLKVKCKFVLEGCTELVRFVEKDHHERTCRFEPLSCPFPQCNDFHGKYEQLQEHVKQKHPENWSELSRVRLTDRFMALQFSMRPTDRFHLLFNFNMYFVVHRKKSSLGDICYVSLPKILTTRYGTMLAFQYSMVITIVSTSNGEASSTFRVEAHSCVDDSNSTPRDAFVVVTEDRSVDIAVAIFVPALERLNRQIDD